MHYLIYFIGGLFLILYLDSCIFNNGADIYDYIRYLIYAGCMYYIVSNMLISHNATIDSKFFVEVQCLD